MGVLLRSMHLSLCHPGREMKPVEPGPRSLTLTLVVSLSHHAATGVAFQPPFDKLRAACCSRSWVLANAKFRDDTSCRVGGRAELRVASGRGLEQRAGIFVLRRAEHLRRRPLLDDDAPLHHGDAVADLGGD